MVLIVAHELGHFIAAKKMGMRVERFSLFFGPMLFKRTKGETTYGVGVIPLGGYVKITGMNPDDHFESPEVARRAYYHQPVWKRIIVIGAGPAVNLMIAFVLLFALAFGAIASTDEPIVGEVEVGAPAAAVLEPGDRIISVDGKTGDQVALAQQVNRHRCSGREAKGCTASKPAVVRVQRGDRTLTYQIAPRFREDTPRRMALGVQYRDGTEVASVAPNSAAAGKLRPGDRVLSIDGQRGNELDFARTINSDAHVCAGNLVTGCEGATPAVIRLRRGESVRTALVTPRFEKETVRRMRLGFAYGRPLDPSVPQAANEALTGMWRVASRTATTIARIFDAEKRKELSSVVGGYESTRQAIQINLRLALVFLAVISLALAIINLFPFLPLDGGHIFWSLVEKVRGRPVPFRIMEQASAVGFVLVLMLFAVGLSNDIGRLSGDGFGVR